MSFLTNETFNYIDENEIVSARKMINTTLKFNHFFLYEVKHGDNYRKIARKVFGNADDWDLIAYYNKQKAWELKKGDVIKIPYEKI